MPSNSFLSPQYINGIYIPSALLLGGVAIVKQEWLPYAVVLAIVLGSWKVFSNSKGIFLFLVFLDWEISLTS